VTAISDIGYASNSGFTLRNLARLVVPRALISSSAASRSCAPVSQFETLLFGSLMLPNTIASPGKSAGTPSRFRRLDFAAAFALGFDLGFLNSLHAVGALFHDAAHATVTSGLNDIP